MRPSDIDDARRALQRSRLSGGAPNYFEQTSLPLAQRFDRLRGW